MNDAPVLSHLKYSPALVEAAFRLVAMLLLMASATSVQAIPDDGGVVTFETLGGGNAEVTGCIAACPAALTIPGIVSNGGPNYTVTEIDDDAFDGEGLTSVIIPSGVTSIGSSAFATNILTSVTIPIGVTSISYAAFAFNILTSVTIPANVTSIGQFAFAFNAITGVTIPSSVTNIANFAFRNNQITRVDFDGDRPVLGTNLFLNNVALTTITYLPGRAGWPGVAIGGIVPVARAVSVPTLPPSMMALLVCLMLLCGVRYTRTAAVNNPDY